MGNYSPLLFLLIAAAAAAVATVVCGAAVETCPGPGGPWTEISRPFVQDLGRWAVEQQHAVLLHFDKVETARFQCVDDYRGSYELVIDASNGGNGDVDNKYRAVVHVLEMMRPERVLSFDAISAPPTN